MPEAKRRSRPRSKTSAREKSRRGASERRPEPVPRGPGPRGRVPRPPHRLLAVDIGNSETVIGVLEGREVVRSWRLMSGPATTDDVTLRLEPLLRGAGWQSPAGAGAVVCSVAPSLTLPWVVALTRWAGQPPLEVTAQSARSLPIRYHDRAAVGADRIANAVAARGFYGTPAIVVDLGTATTFDCVSQQGAYLGGVIAPGVATSAEELFRRAARLPRVELRRPVRALGRTTEESIQSGVIWGAAGQVDALVRRLALEMRGTPHVIATGGLARFIAPECETVNRVDETLTLRGMALLWEENL